MPSLAERRGRLSAQDFRRVFERVLRSDEPNPIQEIRRPLHHLLLIRNRRSYDLVG